MSGLPGRKVANHIQSFRRGFEVGIGKPAAVGDREIGTSHFQRYDAHLRLACRDLSGGKVARSYVVVVPEIQVNGLAARK